MRPSALGLPTDNLIDRTLAICGAPPAIAIQLWIDDGTIRVGRVYLRIDPDAPYELVGSPSSGESDESLVSSGFEQILFLRKNVRLMGGNRVGSVASIVRFNVRTRAIEYLRPTCASDCHVLVSELHWASADGQVLLASVAFAREGEPIKYQVAQIDLAADEMVPLLPLHAVFA